MSHEPLIFHGTPLTPREALEAIGPARVFCVSFFHPADVEVVEAISPAIMFRQRRIFRMDGSDQARGAVVYPRRLAPILRLAGAPFISPRPMGGHSRRAWRAEPAQRQPIARMAVRAVEGRAALAYGWPYRAIAPALRTVRSGLSGVDWHRRGQGGGLRGMVAAHGRNRAIPRQPLAGLAYDARRVGGARVSIQQRGRHERRAEWSSI